MIACWTSQWKNILRKNSSSSKIIQGSGQRGKKTKLLNSEKGPQVQIIQLLAGLSSIFFIFFFFYVLVFPVFFLFLCHYFFFVFFLTIEVSSPFCTTLSIFLTVGE